MFDVSRVLSVCCVGVYSLLVCRLMGLMFVWIRLLVVWLCSYIVVSVVLCVFMFCVSNVLIMLVNILFVLFVVSLLLLVGLMVGEMFGVVMSVFELLSMIIVFV